MAALRVNRRTFGRACWTDVQFTQLTLSLNPANTVVCWLPSCPHKVDVDSRLSYISIWFIRRLGLQAGSYTPPRKTPSRNYISPKNTWPKLHYPEHTFP